MNIIILDNHKLIISEIKRQVLSVLPSAECVCFTKQREAIEYVKKHRVDVALLDVDMPGLNGIEVAELMCQINPRLNIIFVTVRASFQKLRFPFEETVDSFQYDDVRDAKAIGERLRTLRKERGLTARELADEIGVSYTTIYRWENGDRIPDGFNMGKLMNVLGVRLKDIVSDIDIHSESDTGGDRG